MKHLKLLQHSFCKHASHYKLVKAETYTCGKTRPAAKTAQNAIVFSHPWPGSTKTENWTGNGNISLDLAVHAADQKQVNITP